MIGRIRELFPVGTPVILKGELGTGTSVTAETIGTVVGWRSEATGAWYSRNGNPKIENAGGRLQLLRLLLRKADGEMTDLVIDDLTSIAKLEAM